MPGRQIESDMTSSPLKTPTPSGSFLSLTPTPTGTRLGFRRIPLPFARGSLVGYFSLCVNSVCFLAFGARGKEERRRGERKRGEPRVRAPKENKAEIEKPFSCDANIESLDKSAAAADTSLPDAHVSVRSCPRVKLFGHRTGGFRAGEEELRKPGGRVTSRPGAPSPRRGCPPCGSWNRYLACPRYPFGGLLVPSLGPLAASTQS